MFAYGGDDLGNPHLRGIETSLIQLAEVLAQHGHEIRIFNNRDTDMVHQGVHWQPLTAAKRAKADVVVAINDPRLLSLSHAKRRIVWMHNVTSLEKALRKGRLWPMLRYPAITVFSSRYQARTTTRLLTPYGKRVIPLGVNSAFLVNPEIRRTPPSNLAFTTQAYRGLDVLLGIWPRIRAACPQAILHLFLDPADVPAGLPEGVQVRGIMAWPELAVALKEMRAVVFPWDKPETFCLAAAEAQALGVPVVTRNVGALPERIRDGVTGVAVSSLLQMTDVLIQLLRENQIWQHLHQGAVANPQGLSWQEVAVIWKKHLLAV